MFIIKKHYEATAANKNYAGEIKDYYEGKSGHLIGSNHFPVKWEIENYGYKTLAAANKGLKKAAELSEWETSHGYWNVTAELVEVNV